MDLKQLSYFVKIVEEGSISGAAKKLFMSQPPLSSQMSFWKLNWTARCLSGVRGPSV